MKLQRVGALTHNHIHNGSAIMFSPAECSLHLTTTVSHHCSLFMGWNVTCDLEMDLSEKFLILFWGAEIFGKCNSVRVVFLKQRVCKPRLLVPLITTQVGILTQRWNMES